MTWPPASPQPCADPRAVAGVWTDFEAPLWPHRYGGQPPGNTVLTVPATTSPQLLVTAPHAVAHMRGSRRKGADVASGGLAWLAATAVGAGCLVASGEQAADGNRDAHGVFKDALRQELATGQVQAVLDVHGMEDTFGYDVCLGTGMDHDGAQPLLVPVRDSLSRAGFVVSVNDPWAAEPEHTVTNTAHRAGLLGLQVEVARKWRQPWEEPVMAARMVAALTGAFTAVATRLRSDRAA